jgi:stringent starvation protein B
MAAPAAVFLNPRLFIMASTKPYLIRALWQWCVDQGQTPYLVVVPDEHTEVPAGYVKDGQITLNLGAEATHHLDIGNEFISFQARFGGVAQSLLIPVNRVLAIFSRESNEGMSFEVTATMDAPAPQDPPPHKPDTAPSRPRFTVIK